MLSTRTPGASDGVRIMVRSSAQPAAAWPAYAKVVRAFHQQELRRRVHAGLSSEVFGLLTYKASRLVLEDKVDACRSDRHASSASNASLGQPLIS